MPRGEAITTRRREEFLGWSGQLLFTKLSELRRIEMNLDNLGEILPMTIESCHIERQVKPKSG
jgi:hypothetical protein